MVHGGFDDLIGAVKCSGWVSKTEDGHSSAFFRNPIGPWLSSVVGNRQRPNEFRFWGGGGRKGALEEGAGNAVLAMAVERIDSLALVGLRRSAH